MTMTKADESQQRQVPDCPFCGGPGVLDVRVQALDRRAWPSDYYAPDETVSRVEGAHEAYCWCHECGARGAVLDVLIEKGDQLEWMRLKAIENWRRRPQHGEGAAHG